MTTKTTVAIVTVGIIVISACAFKDITPVKQEYRQGYHREENPQQRTEYTRFDCYYKILDVTRTGARVMLRPDAYFGESGGKEVFIKGLTGYSDHVYKDILRVQQVEALTYTTVMGSSRRIPMYELLPEELNKQIEKSEVDIKQAERETQAEYRRQALLQKNEQVQRDIEAKYIKGQVEKQRQERVKAEFRKHLEELRSKGK